MHRELRTSLWAVAVCTGVWALGSVPGLWAMVGAAALTACLAWVIERREGPDNLGFTSLAPFKVRDLDVLSGFLAANEDPDLPVMCAGVGGLRPLQGYFTCRVGATRVVVLESTTEEKSAI
jgi:hypothetical protein